MSNLTVNIRTSCTFLQPARQSPVDQLNFSFINASSKLCAVIDCSIYVHYNECRRKTRLRVQTYDVPVFDGVF